jgi:hypothetical protein
MFRAVRIGAAAVLVTAALSGCSLIGALNRPPTPAPTATESAEGQTAKEACDLLLPVMIDMNSRMTATYAELQKSGPEKASPLLHGISDDLHVALEQITNEEVHDVTSTAIDSLDTMITEIDNVIAGRPDQAALLAASGAVNRDFSAIDPVCQAAEAE